MEFELLTIGWIPKNKEWWFIFCQVNFHSLFSIGNGFYKFDGRHTHYQIFIFKFCGIGFEKRIRKI